MKNTDTSYDNEFKWTSSDTTTLGITFSNQLNTMFDSNLANKITECKHVLKQWKKWNLTLIGKITVLKTFVLPKLIYPLTVLPNPPPDFVKSIKYIFFDFLWNSKPDKIARKLIIQEYKDGGLKMIDIECFLDSLKISWIKRIIDSNANWSSQYKNELEKYGGLLLFKCNITEQDCKFLDIKSKFLKDILISWSKVNTLNTEIQISKQIIWNNSNIKKISNNKLFYYKHWFRKGILFLEHIFDFRHKTFYSFEQMKFLY